MTIRKPTKRIGISLTGVTAEFKSEYDKLAKNKNMTHIEFAKVLLENYKHFNVDFIETEIAIIDQALRTAPITYRKKIKKAVLRCATGVVDSNTTDATVDTDKINSSKAADKRVDILLQLMFKHNETTTNKYDKIFISKSSLLEFINKTKEVGDIEVTTSKTVIGRCFERRSSLIEAHHVEQELNSNHNLKAYYERLKATNSTHKTIEV